MPPAGVSRCGFPLKPPDEVARCARSLREIYLDDNRIQELQKSFFKLTQLEKASLESNDIYRIPHELGNLINLLDLNLSRNDIQKSNE